MKKSYLKMINSINILLLFVCIVFIWISAMLADKYMLYLNAILILCFSFSFLISNIINKIKFSVCIEIIITMIVFYIFAMTGYADGFGILCLIILPPIYTYMLPVISGSVICSIMTVSIMIVFWSPLNILCYNYGEFFFISFPLLLFVSVMISVIAKYVITSEKTKMRKYLSGNIKLKNSLQRRVNEQTVKLCENMAEATMMQHSMVIAAIKVIESRDVGTGRHVRLSSEYAYMLAYELYKKRMYKDIIDEEFLKIFREAASLHDIGKIQIPDAILCKEGKLTDEEFEVMKTHAQAGGNLIMSSMKNFNTTRFVSIGYDVAVYHHERWDGAGYPDGRKGKEIPLPARIMSVADVFEALTAKRTYKPAYSIATAFNIIESESGKQFDSEIVDVFIGMRSEISKRYMELERIENENEDECEIVF